MKKKAMLALSLSMAAGGLFISAPQAPPVFAAETNSDLISQEEAAALAKKYAAIPENYELDAQRFNHDHHLSSAPMWNLHFSKGREGMNFAIDARSGKLLTFSRYQHDSSPIDGTSIDRDRAEQIARQFLQKAAEPRELEQLSDANEYEQPFAYWGMTGVHSVTYTRLKEEIPFLENYFQIAVDREGNVIEFLRRWHDGELPSADDAVISLEQAREKLTEETAPSLSYVRLDERVGDYAAGERPYSLVYQYGPNDGSIVDATTGALLNAQGQPAKDSSIIQPLGSSKSPTVVAKRIDKNEAKIIADEIMNRFPVSYESEGIAGSGASSGADGIMRNTWSFTYVPVNAEDPDRQRIQIHIDDAGQVSSFYDGESHMIGPNEKANNPISWEEAKNRAVETVKILFADQLGNLYLQSKQPTDDALKTLLDIGGNYLINFGWLKDGIPIENATIHAQVHPQTGKIVHLWSAPHPNVWAQLDELQPSIDAERAKQIALENQKVTLSYFQPSLVESGIPGTTKPMLAYRHIGDAGVVDAVRGEWISFSALREGKQPQDIDQHPSKEALRYAVQKRFLKVENGLVHPNLTVTRGELVTMLVSFANELPIRAWPIDWDPQTKPFHDVDENSALYSAIQHAIRFGIISKEGTAFRPHAEASRVELAEMVARMLGYEKLLTKTDIFKTSYEDVAPENVPAVAIGEAFELWKETGTEFEPHRPATRAEVAETLYQLARTFQQTSR